MGSRGQHVGRHQQGMQVHSCLLHGGTMTALLELVIGISHMQTNLARMRRLMQNQQQYLQQMLIQRHQPHDKLPLMQQQLATSVKTESETVLHHSSAAASVKLEENAQEQHKLGKVPTANEVPIESEIGRTPRSSTQTERRQEQAPGWRQRQHGLAWHVVSSGVVQISHAGLRHTVLEVRPPPPWSLAAPSQNTSTINLGLEAPAADTDVKPDIVMLDAEQPATAQQNVESPARPQAQDTPPTAGQSFQPPVPILTLHMQWQLAPSLASDSSVVSDFHLPFAAAATVPQHSFQGLPPSQGLAVPAPQGLHLPQKLPASQDQQHLPGDLVNGSKEQSDFAGSAKQGMPMLRCCICSEPQLPSQILQSFEDMAGVLISCSFCLS